MVRASFILGILFLAIGCATLGSPEGGPKDDKAPALVQEKSAPPLRTNEKNRLWFFEFNEFVRLDNPGQNVLVSPPLTYPLEVRVYGKKVRVRLDDREQLQENTTYIINFGQTIKDITEGNSATGLQHIFSTGPVIDSLSISGQILQAYTSEPTSNAKILLYDNLRDSAFLNEKPLYIGFPDSSGLFELNYLRSDTFQLVALKDNNANLSYDGPPEQLAFYSQLIYLDSAEVLDTPLILFEEESLPRMEEYGFASGLLTLNWSQEFVDTPSFSFQGIEKAYQRLEEKTLKLWYLGEPDINTFFILEGKDQSDTIKLRYTKSKDLERLPDFTSTNKLQASSEAQVTIDLQTPVVDFNVDSIFFLHDTTIIPADQILLEDAFSMKIGLPEKVFKKGGLLILDNGALEDFSGQPNDSINIPVSPFDLEAVGNIYLSVDTLNPELQYIVQLRKKEGNWKNEAIVSGVEVHRDSFYHLQPGVYQIDVIEDLDRNSRWTSGNYLERSQPEAVFKGELEELKANWELESQVKVNAVLKAK